jgi:transposase
MRSGCSLQALAPTRLADTAELRLIQEQRRTDRVGQRKRYSAAFNAKVALEAIRGDATVAEPVSKQGVQQTLITTWKRQAIGGMAGVFSNKAEGAAAEREGQLEKPRARICQPVVERNFLAKGEPSCATGSSPMASGKAEGLAGLSRRDRRLRWLTQRVDGGAR